VAAKKLYLGTKKRKIRGALETGVKTTGKQAGGYADDGNQRQEKTTGGGLLKRHPKKATAYLPDERKPPGPLTQVEGRTKESRLPECGVNAGAKTGRVPERAVTKKGLRTK